MIRGDGAVYIWLACLLLILPLEWIVSAFLAAAIHEICHVAVLFLFGGRIVSIKLSVTGRMVKASGLQSWQSVCSILAGPAGSLMLLFFSSRAPKIAVCGLVHGLYNLLPILPLDGGRILQFLLYRWYPLKADCISYVTGSIVCAVIFLSALHITVALQLGFAPVILTLLWILRMYPRKIPCKPPQIKVQ